MCLKSVFLFIFIVSFSLRTISQTNYTVIKVIGGIQYKTSKKAMTQGDVFNQTEPLIFSNSESKAAVINKQKGRFMITPPVSGNLNAQANFVPAMGNISSRAGLISNAVELKNTFSGTYLIIEKVQVKISKSVYPMNDTSFFYLSYLYNGEEINKKLAFMEDSFIIEKESLFTVDGKPIPIPDVSAMKLYYLSADVSTLVCQFTAVFPELNSLKAEVTILLNELPVTTFSEKVDEVCAYLNENYGKPNVDNVKLWLMSEFGLH